MKKKVVLNILTGFGGQLFVMLLGIIVPRILITGYGSDTNGLLGTITQIYTYMALLEAGIGQAARNALFKPFSQNNREEVSHIASIAQAYFKRITAYYGLGVIALSLLLPLIVKSNCSYSTIALITLLQGMSGVVSFFFIQTKSIILMVDGKGYVRNSINVISQSIHYAVQIILAGNGVSVLFIQASYFMITVLKVVIYKIYFDKKYQWINFSKSSPGEKLKDRNAFILTEIAWTMFSSTDMIVLSVFLSTEMASVYSVYNLVYTGINVLLNSIYSNVLFVLGRTYHKNKTQYCILHDSFTAAFFGGMCVLMSVTYVLVLPFIKLYTSGADINYSYTYLPVMFCLVQILSWSRYVSGNLTGIAGYAKPVSHISLIEACINIILSIVFARQYGIVGVLFATVIALPIKVIYCTFISDVKILKRSMWNSLKILIPNSLLFIVTVFAARKLPIKIMNYLDFAIYGVVLLIVLSLIDVLINFCINPKLIHTTISFIKRRSMK